MKDQTKRNRLARLQHAAERMLRPKAQTPNPKPSRPSIRQHMADINKREVSRG